MESLNRNTDFQTQLTQINFKTFYHNQLETFGYDDLFANRRVVIFSISRTAPIESYFHLKEFNLEYDNIIQAGADNVYAINSFDVLFGPWVDRHADNIIGLPDTNHNFITELAKSHHPDSNITKLSKYWQYILILNNGVLEIIWKNVYRDTLSRRILNDPGYQYRKLKPSLVLEYLKYGESKKFLDTTV